MPGKLILLGDNISHGGTVIEASPESFAGITVARISDMTASGAVLIASQALITNEI